MKILVTGGNGYIGSHTLIELIKSNFDVISIDNLSRSQRGTMERIETITQKRVKNYEIDLCDKDALFAVLAQEERIDGVIHFAAYKSVPESVVNPCLYYQNNLNSLINVLNGCEAFKIPHFIFSSSCSVYGEATTLPVTEETPIGEAMCPYAHTKQIGESIIRAFAQQHPSFNSVILRYFNPVGADMSGENGELTADAPANLMPILMETGSGRRAQMTVYGTDYDTPDGSCIRDYIHITDLANAHVKALAYLANKKKEEPIHEIFNIGTGKGISVLEMIKAFEENIGRKLNYTIGERRAGDIPIIYSDNKKAKQLLGWECKHDLADMITSAWRWEEKLANLTSSRS